MPILHMETEVARSTGQALGNAAANLSQELQCINQSVQSLSTAWLSDSANVFMAEIMPVLQRLNGLVQDGETLNRRLQQEVDEWEAVDAGNASAVSFPAYLAGFVTGHASGQNVGQSVTLNISQPTVPSVPLPQPRWAPYPEADLTYNPAWANTAELNQAMNDFVTYLHDHPDLVKPPYTLTRELQGHLESLAKARELPYADVVRDYSRYVQLLNGNTPSLLEDPAYWGSTQQLRFGNVVGDSMGVDPIFGAMLSPTGGLIGRGEQDQNTVDNIEHILKGFNFVTGSKFPVDDLKSSLMNHGVYHDAAGFLQREYGVGPGYQYFERFPVLEEFIESYPPLQSALNEHPEYHGHFMGIAHWYLWEQQQKLKALF